MSNREAKTRGVHHVGLTVPDIGDARAFFIHALGFEQAGEVPDYPAVFVSDGTILITLWQAENPREAVPFDRRANIGLHHLALRVDDLADLANGLRERDDVELEFEPQMLGDTGIQHMMCRIPGDIRVEFIAA